MKYTIEMEEKQYRDYVPHPLGRHPKNIITEELYE